MRFFIGIDYKEPRAFGIYKEPATGNCVVYKNKADGSRAIRYTGTDEAYAVNEIYQKMRAELLEHKQADLDRGKTTKANSSPKPAKRKKRSDALIWGVIIAIAAMFVLAYIVLIIDEANTPNKGYYNYQGTPYYYSGGVWYTPDDDGGWERTYDAPDSLKEDYNDYFEAKDYGDLDADYADDIEEYPTEEYSYDNDDDDSWNDSNWDDDDWDYDYDDYDYFDSDWDSDW